MLADPYFTHRDHEWVFTYHSGVVCKLLDSSAVWLGVGLPKFI